MTSSPAWSPACSPDARPGHGVQVDRWGSIPILRFKDKQSYGHNKTKEYDEQATKYLSYLLFPLVGGYAVWALFYQTHKSWYSWVVTSLTGCVYTFGEGARGAGTLSCPLQADRAGSGPRSCAFVLDTWLSQTVLRTTLIDLR